MFDKVTSHTLKFQINLFKCVLKETRNRRSKYVRLTGGSEPQGSIRTDPWQNFKKFVPLNF